jgi:hypothetical protein
VAWQFAKDYAGKLPPAQVPDQEQIDA